MTDRRRARREAGREDNGRPGTGQGATQRDTDAHKISGGADGGRENLAREAGTRLQFHLSPPNSFVSAKRQLWSVREAVALHHSGKRSSIRRTVCGA